MQIAGFQKTSFIDYPGLISSVVFTSGCNFRCLYCHNWQIISGEVGVSDREKEIFDYLDSKKKIIEGIVITGGEPCLQKDLVGFLSELRKKGLKIKLDTNGSFPSVLSEIISKRLVDYIAMDIKAPFSRYSEISGFGEIEKIKESIGLIMNSGIDYEFRTTAYPSLGLEDYKEISEQIKGAKRYFIQQYRVENVPKGSEMEALSLGELEKFCSLVSGNVGKCELRY